MLSFNRRSLLRHQSSIAVLQSAGVLSNSESRITEFLTSADADGDESHGDAGHGHSHDPFKIISRAQSASEARGTTELVIDPLVTSMLLPSRTPSSTSVISGVTAVTDIPVDENNLTSKESKKSSLISNFGIFGSGIGSSSNSQNVESKNDQDDLCGDLSSLYGGDGRVDDRPLRKPFFSTKSQQNSSVPHRLTFSHENPISSASTENKRSLPDAGATSTTGGSGSFGGLVTASSSKKLSHVKSSFSKSSSYDASSASASVGAENASRFMKRRSVTTLLEGRASGLTSPTDFTTTTNSEQPKSPASSFNEETADDVSVVSNVSRPSVRDKLRRRGSASAALAQQTAQFRKKVSDQAGSTVEE